MSADVGRATFQIGLLACVAGASLACSSANREPGEPCYDGDCRDGAFCAQVLRMGVFESVCVESCDPPVGHRCAGGEVCMLLRTDTNELGCYPGGDIPEAETCEFSYECTRGTWCVGFAGDVRVCVVTP